MDTTHRLTLIAGGLLLSATAIAREPATPALQSFEFLGCSGDLQTNDNLQAEVWRVTDDGRVTFLVHHADTCGMSGRNPVVRGDGDALVLDYELHSPPGVTMMCECEYWAKFTFGADAYAVRRIEFGGMTTRLRGEWPESP